ncbi:MAG: sigma D regulator [Gammaproteobacteria bacterium]|nr:sigma D regulator [Gammaproteobacteria bacterium]
MKKRLDVGNSQIDTIAEIAQKVSAENDRRQRQTHTINELLNERQEVLVAMCQLADLDAEVPADMVASNLKSFSQTLVDYTALGHFEIYERIIEGKERRVSVSQVANMVYPTISATTEKIVEFNDKYEGVDDSESLQGLHDDLSAIGEVMAERIESEDQLLQEMNGRVFNNTN